MAAVVLRLRRGRLGPTSFLFARIESHIHLLRRAAAAAASPPSPAPSRPTHLGSSIHPHRPPSPCSAPSGASMDSHRTPSSIHPHRRPSPRSAPSAASIDSHRTASPRPIHFAPTVSLHRLSPPRSTPSTFSVGDHCYLGLLATVEAGPRALRKGRKATLHSVGIKAARRFLSLATPKVTPSRSLLGSGQTRSFSSGDPASPKVNQSKPPPVSQLVFRDDLEVSTVEWIDPIPYLKKHSLVTDARTNHLNMEILDFADHPQYNFSEDTGVPLFQCLIFLALVNNNRGYCVKKAFKKENLLLCSKLKQFRFKNPDPVALNPNSKDLNRRASYVAAGKLMRELLHETVGPDTVSYLLVEPRDLFSKMEYPSHERLIVYHTSLLSKLASVWFYHRLYWFYFKFLAFSKDKELKKKAEEALAEMAYTSPTEQSVVDIVKSHPWLEKIDSKKPIRDTENEEKCFSGEGVAESAQPQKVNDSCIRGKMVVALPRHAIEHAFDKHVRLVQSKFSTKVKPKKLWPYSLDDVVDLLRSILPLHLLKAQENFLRMDFGLISR